MLLLVTFFMGCGGSSEQSQSDDEFLAAAYSKLPSQLGLAKSHDKFLGNVWNQHDLESDDRKDAYTQLWSLLTLELDGTWARIEATRNEMQLDSIREAYNWAKENNAAYRHFGFVWGSLAPAWIGALSKSEQLQEVEELISTVCTQFTEIDFIDMVVEPLASPASYRKALGGEGETGWDWVIASFELGRKWCPHSLLGLTEYNIVDNSDKRARYMELIEILNNRNLLDVIGIQFRHTSSRVMTAESTHLVLDELAQFNLPISIQEFEAADIRDDPETRTSGDTYKELFPVIWQHPAVLSVTINGQRKNETWGQFRLGVLNDDGSDAAEMGILRGYFSNEFYEKTKVSEAPLL